MLIAILTLVTLVGIVRYVPAAWRTFRRNCTVVAHVPGFELLVHPHHLLAMFVPRAPGLNLGNQYCWRYKHGLFDRGAGVDAIKIVAAVPHIRSFVVADSEAVRYVMTERRRFVKPVIIYSALRLFGPNVGVLEAAQWSRHRRIVAGPTFADSVNAAAWTEAARTLDLCFDDWQVSQPGPDVRVDSMVALTLKLALFAISAAAFSHRPPWRDDAVESLPVGHSMSFRASLHGVLEHIFAYMILPDFAYRLPISRVRHIGAAFRELHAYLDEMIAERRASGFDARESDTGRRDLLGALVHASAPTADATGVGGADDVDKAGGRASRLDDDEVRGNMYVLLLAGHDTTAHTLAFCFALLALHPDVQQRLLEHIDAVVPPHRDPARLGHTHPSLICADIRGLPAADIRTRGLSRNAPALPVRRGDTALLRRRLRGPGRPATLGRARDDLHTGRRRGLRRCSCSALQSYVPVEVAQLMMVPSRTLARSVCLQARALRRRGRWLVSLAKRGLHGLQRRCLGQKFAQIEAVAIIALLVRRYSLRLREDVDDTAPVGETFQQKCDRILRAHTIITLTPAHVPFILRRRAD